MLKGFLKTCRQPKVSNEMKCTNEKMTWNTKHTNLSRYVPKANVDHTINGQGISTLDHSVTTSRAHQQYWFNIVHHDWANDLTKLGLFHNEINWSSGCLCPLCLMLLRFTNNISIVSIVTLNICCLITHWLSCLK